MINTTKIQNISTYVHNPLVLVDLIFTKLSF